MSIQLQMLFRRRNYPAWIVLSICLIVLMLAQFSLHRQMATQATQAFHEQTQGTIDTVVNHLKQHEQILLGAAGMFDASHAVDRSEWRTYVERLNLAQNYPGNLGVGFSRVIRPAELASHVVQIRAEGFPDYRIYPSGERSLYTAIIYLEPFTGRNQAALGYDMLSEPTRARAMRLAVDENRSVMTGKVILGQESQGKAQTGFLLYVPVYRLHMPQNTPAQRWAAMQGYVYSVYHMEDLMRALPDQTPHSVDFSIYDGKQPGEASLLYTSSDASTRGTAGHIPQFNIRRTLHVYGHTWTLAVSSRPEFEKKFRSSLDMPMIILGLSTSLMLFFLVSMLSYRRIQAEAQAQLLERLINEKTKGLREALDLQTAVLDNAPHAIIATNSEGVITVFNNKAEQLLGYTAQEMIGKQTPALFHDPQEVVERAQAFSAELHTPLEPGFEVFVIKSRLRLPNTHEWIHICKDGSRFPVSLSITALRNERQEITGFLGMIIDITAQKAAERELREYAEHTQAILDNIADGIITINQQGIIQTCNLAAEKIFGYHCDEMIGRNVNMLMPEPYYSLHNSYLENYHATGIAKIIGINREVEGQHRNGSVFPMDLAVSQSTHQGQTLYIGLVRDITERKRADKMKSDFIASASHDLRTPLTAISGSLGLVAAGALGELPAQIKQMIDIAYKNVLRLGTLVNNLLDMNKLLAGKMQLHPRTQALMPIIEQTLQNMHAYAEQYQVTFVITERADHAVVHVDELRLQQVLGNFLSNAAKFSPAGSRVEIAAVASGEQVRVSVTDHGPGIPEAIHNRIFQKLSRINASEPDHKGGAGLGLAISRELIERMHGTTGFESAAGKGSCFYFELPQEKNATATTASPDTPAGAPQILIVEDEPDISRLFSIMLTNAGYRVDLAPTAESALTFLNQKRYDAMTLDLMLPDQSGIKLIQKIRSQPHTESLPIIVISAYSEDGKLAITGEFNAIDWLEKPVNSSQLVSSIQRALPEQPGNKPRVLHVEDNASLTRLIATLGRNVAEFDTASSLAEARSKLVQSHYNIVVLDLGLPDGSGWDLLPVLQTLQPKPAVIVLSGHELSATEKASVEAVLMKASTPNEIILNTLKQLLADKQKPSAE